MRRRFPPVPLLQGYPSAKSSAVWKSNFFSASTASGRTSFSSHASRRHPSILRPWSLSRHSSRRSRNRSPTKNRSQLVQPPPESIQSQSQRIRPTTGRAENRCQKRSWPSGLHRGLDLTAAEDASRVLNRNGQLVLGILRRCAMGTYCDWRRGRKKAAFDIEGLPRQHTPLQQPPGLRHHHLTPPMTPAEIRHGAGFRCRVSACNSNSAALEVPAQLLTKERSGSRTHSFASPDISSSIADNASYDQRYRRPH